MTDNQQAWLAALRSGSFAQCQGKLTRIVGGQLSHCCLGVACELALASGVPMEQETFTSHENLSWRRYDYDQNFAPVAVLNWVGLKTREGRFLVTDDMNIHPAAVTVIDGMHYDADGFNVGDRASSLAALNDSAGWSFAQIADFIEARPEVFFV